MFQNLSPFFHLPTVAIVTVAWLLAGTPVPAQEMPSPPPEEAERTPAPGPASTPAAARKDLALDLPGRRLDYTATAEMMPIVNGQGETTARIFVASYIARDTDRAI